MNLFTATVLENELIMPSTHVLTLQVPRQAQNASPGQFLHIRIPHLGESVLRRPFSVFKVEGATLGILYKDVGKGTRSLKFLRPGEALSIIGPLGRGFPNLSRGCYPVLVAGGYGMAALYLTCRELPVKGVAFFGGRTAQDILCVDEFVAHGWDVRITTEDGSLGAKGRVTDALDAWWKKEGRGRKPEFFACGPNGMLKAVADRAAKHKWTAWVSMDNNMGCGVGACLTCVLKVKKGKNDWSWRRACCDGPVFDTKEILWDEI